MPYNFDPDIKGHIQYNGHQEGRQMVHFKNEGMVYHKGAQTKIFRKTYTNLRVSIEVAGPDQTRKLPNKINFCKKKRNGHTDFDNANKIKKQGLNNANKIVGKHEIKIIIFFFFLKPFF